MRYILFMLVAFAFLFGCSEPEKDAWAKEKIRKAENGNKEDIDTIQECKYGGTLVYYIKYGCCDRYNTVHNSIGTEMCSPDGGMVGSGDGKCPDFFDRWDECTLLWEKKR